MEENVVGLIKVWSLLIFLLCTVMFLWQAYVSITNHLSKPTTSSFTTKPISKVEFPDIEICWQPKYSTTRLAEYGYVDVSQYLSDAPGSGWRGANATADTEELYEHLQRVTNKSTAILSMAVRYREGGQMHTSHLPSALLKPTPMSMSDSQCHLLRLDKEITRHPMSSVMFKLDRAVASKCWLKLSYRGQLMQNAASFKRGGETIEVRKDHMINYKVMLRMLESLEEDPKTDCALYGEDREYATYDRCYLEKVTSTLKRALGCLPPYFAVNKSDICQKAISFTKLHAIYLDLENGKVEGCLTPCHSLESITIKTSEAKMFNITKLQLMFYPEVEVVVTQLSTTWFTVLAEVGGNLGLWLGASVLNMSIDFSSFVASFRSKLF